MSLKVPTTFNSNRVALLDGDIINYRCGFASQHTIYDLVDMQSGGIVESFNKKTDLKDWLLAYYDDDDLDFVHEFGFVVEEEKVVEPVENCLHSVKQLINSILAATGSGHYEIYLTGKGNFREEVAVSKPYKGTRKEDKPEHYDAIKKYLIHQWKAKVIEGIEADDMLSIRLREQEDATCASLDKDLDMVPGWHYNFSSGENVPYYVSNLEGAKAFWKQMVTGDTVDNIPGLPGCGQAKAQVIEGCKTEGQMYTTVKCLYEDKGFDSAYLDEQATLLWMLRTEDDSWAAKKAELGSMMESENVVEMKNVR